MPVPWDRMNPKSRERHYARNSARFRALSRLKMRYPEEFQALFEEELAEGPIYLADRRTFASSPESEAA